MTVSLFSSLFPPFFSQARLATKRSGAERPAPYPMSTRKRFHWTGHNSICTSHFLVRQNNFKIIECHAAKMSRLAGWKWRKETCVRWQPYHLCLSPFSVSLFQCKTGFNIIGWLIKLWRVQRTDLFLKSVHVQPPKRLSGSLEVLLITSRLFRNVYKEKLSLKSLLYIKVFFSLLKVYIRNIYFSLLLLQKAK